MNAIAKTLVSEKSEGNQLHSLDPLLRPESIALIGASRRRNSVGNDMIRNLVPSGFTGPVFPINPSYKKLYGWTCYTAISELPQSVDLAVLSVPNRVLEQVVIECIEAGARALVIFASAEVDEAPDDRLRDRVGRLAHEAGVPLCGANCMGFFNPKHNLRAFSAYHPDPINTGGLTYIAQSGSLLQALLFNDERLCFNLAVSTGQELVTTAADYLDFALEQPETKCVAMVLEAIRDPEGFVQALAKAEKSGIPIIVLKLGRTEAGANFALSHTGAIAGDAEVYEALFRRYGVISVSDLNELAATALIMCCDKKLAEGGVSAVLDSGGERELIVDVASDENVIFADISDKTKAVLTANLDTGLTAENPVDAWGTGRDFEAVFENCLLALMEDDNTALGMFVADLAEDLDLHAGYVEVCQSVARATDKPLIVMTNYSAWSHRKHAVRLSRAGVIVLDGTVSTMRAIKNAMTYRDFIAQKDFKEMAHVENSNAEVWRKKLRNSAGPLTEDEGYRLLQDYGIRVPEFGIVESADHVAQAIAAIGFPMVAKIAEPGILHKSDVGGVLLNITNEEEAQAAYKELSHKLGPRVLFSRMVDGDAEMAFGLVKDEQFGCFVMIAFGGVWIEILKDSQLAKVPVNRDVAERQIANLKMAKVLEGVRGAPPCDVPALIETYIKFSQMVTDLGDDLSEVDINPILVSATGVIAVDSLIVPANTNNTEVTTGDSLNEQSSLLSPTTTETIVESALDDHIPTDLVLYQRNGPIAEITLNLPSKLNSITPEMIESLNQKMDIAESDSMVRVIALFGNGRAFSAGFDLGTMTEDPSLEEMSTALQQDFDVIMRFWNSKKPTISAVQGYALGGGFELAMACDVTIAADNAMFGEPEPKFGSGIVALLLPWLTGPKQAREMLLFGNDRVNAERALQVGLVNAVVPQAELIERAREMANNAAKLDSLAVRMTKDAINKSYGRMGIEGALCEALAIDIQIETSETEESRTFKRLLATEGTKAAIAWREARFATNNTPNATTDDETMTYTALVVDKVDDTVTQTLQTLNNETLPDGDVTIAVEYSSVNYKDGLCLSATGGLVRQFPHVPGIDYAGTVEHSTDPRYSAGDKVVLTGWRVGENHWGGYATRTRIAADKLVPLPEGLNTAQAMTVGTAGLSAMLAVMALEKHGLKPGDGEVLVTGATGGVGSVAVAILAKLGYSVAAVTGSTEHSNFLISLGATRIIAREELAETVKRPLETESWAGCIDAVGGSMLARILGQMKHGGSVAAIGLAGGANLPATMVPFLLRGINLLGIDSVMQPFENRQEAWRRIASDLPIEKIEALTTTIPLSEVAGIGSRILTGDVRGRTVVEL